MALSVTEQIVEEIEPRVAGAFAAKLPREASVRPAMKAV